MILKFTELKKTETKNEKKPQILTDEYCRKINKDIAYRLRQIEASHIRAYQDTFERPLSRTRILK